MEPLLFLFMLVSAVLFLLPIVSVVMQIRLRGRVRARNRSCRRRRRNRSGPRPRGMVKAMTRQIAPQFLTTEIPATLGMRSLFGLGVDG